jgi:hypothetical protein
MSFFEEYKKWILAPIVLTAILILILLLFSLFGPKSTPFEYAIF